jgi:hypothetical protein
MRLLEAPGRPVIADLEALASLDSGADVVLAFIPPRIYARIRNQLVTPGWRELLTTARREAGNPAQRDRTFDAPRATPAAALAAGAQGPPGRPAAFEADTTRLKAVARFARWQAETLYRARRDT